MARSYSVGLYKLSVRVARKQDSEIDLKQQLSEEVGNFYEYFESCLIKYKTDIFGDEGTDHWLQVKEIETSVHGSKYSKVEGLVQSGDSGFSAVLLDTKKKTSRNKKKEEAELLPYYFCLSETNDPKSSALCLQRFGNSGVLGIFIDFLRQEFKKDFPNLVIQYLPFLPDFYIQKFIGNSGVQEFKYTYLAPASDVVSLLLSKGVREQVYADAVITTKVRSQRGFSLSIKNGIKGGVNQVLSQISPKLAIDQRKILDKTITFTNEEGHRRTFSINRPDNDALPYIDVTNEVDRDDNGHPKYDQLKDAVKDILVESELY